MKVGRGCEDRQGVRRSMRARSFSVASGNGNKTLGSFETSVSLG